MYSKFSDVSEKADCRPLFLKIEGKTIKFLRAITGCYYRGCPQMEVADVRYNV